jgi:hypothetical protein
LAVVSNQWTNTSMVRLRGRCPFIDKHQPGRIKHALLAHPTPARAGDFRALLLRRVQPVSAFWLDSSNYNREAACL